MGLRLRRSTFAHQIPVSDDRVLVLHAVTDVRIVVDAEVSRLIDFFAVERRIPEDYALLAGLSPGDPAALVETIRGLTERGILSAETEAEERAGVSGALSPTYGRDPVDLLDRRRRSTKEGGEGYWAAGPARTLKDMAPARRRTDVILLGDCDIQMEAEFLRAEAASRGVDLRVAASFPDDVRLAAERPHDAVLIGALRARHEIMNDPAAGGAPPCAVYLSEAHQLISKLREVTSAPILIDNLPEPTVEPLGLAERGINGHRTRFRLANVSLAELVTQFQDVHVVDVAAGIAAGGSERLLDDGQVGFTHFGSPGWMLQRPASELRAVHGQFPELGPLEALVGGDPYGRETALARTHLDVLSAVLGHDQKKCVILDLDGTLWPGVLAETGSPFSWTPEISGGYSFIGHYFGLHEALLCLKRRGILLACVSKNDEAVVRRLWTYADQYPTHRLLSPEDFVTWRVNWEDKPANILSIADELGFARESLLFIDDHPVERDRVRTRLPEVEVWGEDLLGLRRRLLTDPRLQRAALTAEARARTELVKGELARRRARSDAGVGDAQGLSEAAYRASLGIERRIRRAAAPDEFERIAELLQRTTQFNATGRRFSPAELAGLARREDSAVFAVNVRDRFGDHGLVGACIVEAGEITAFALSCRVLGLGVEHAFLEAVLEDLGSRLETVQARILPTERNLPVRNLYADNGFGAGPDGVWRRTLRPMGVPASA